MSRTRFFNILHFSSLAHEDSREALAEKPLDPAVTENLLTLGSSLAKGLNFEPL